MFKSMCLSNLSVKNSSESTGEDAGGGIKVSHTTANCVVEKKRGFKPSDRHDPNKKQFLTELSQQIWLKNNVSSGGYLFVSKQIHDGYIIKTTIST